MPWGGFAVTDPLLDLFDPLALLVVLVLIIWLVSQHSGWPLSAVIGMLVWLAAFGFAIHLIFG